ncbi:EAL and HDOD domain-containing protein [Variovorax sp. M-6]|uniref:EAL and HDOD domain-containing protein n=1 Tax=Variovorax sp. M-6 TaxID=3233041 RepID=UPI003F94DD4E
MHFKIFQRNQVKVTPAPADQATAAPIESTPSAPRGGFLTYALQLDAQRHIKGYKFEWRAESEDVSASDNFRAVLSTVASNLTGAKSDWRLGKLMVYLDATAEGLVFEELQALPPERVVLCLRLPELADRKLRPALEALRAQGFSIMLCDEEGLPEAPESEASEESEESEESEVADPFGGLALVTHLDVLDGRKELVDGARNLPRPGGPAILPIATRIASWGEFDACASRRIDAFVRGETAIAAELKAGTNLQPASVLIIRVMQMLQRNEDLRAIEAALQNDESLTARLLRHINTLASSHNVEVHSLHHAVGLLGYSALFRWLSLLLATSTKVSGMAYMTKKAIMRGRFVELMGQGALPADESNNLFVAGMFSLIDRVLGIPMEEVLAKVQLPEAVQEAVRTRGGLYGPFVALAESCELDASGAASLATSIGLSAEKVNASHLCAMAWALDVEPSEVAC